MITPAGLRLCALRLAPASAFATLWVTTGVLAGVPAADGTWDTPASGASHGVSVDDGMSAPPRAPKDRPRRDREGAGRGADGADTPARPGAPRKDLLSGPKVVEDEAASGKRPRRDGAGAPRGEGDGPARRPRPEQVRLWLEALKSLELEPEKRDAIRARVEAFAAERSEFERTHGEERRQLEKELREAGRDGAPPQALRERMQALMAKAPNPEAVQREVYAMLSPAEQEALRERFAALEAERAERQAKGRDRQMQGRDGMEGEVKRGEGAPGRDGARPPRAPRAPKGEGEAPQTGERNAPPKRDQDG